MKSHLWEKLRERNCTLHLKNFKFMKSVAVDPGIWKIYVECLPVILKKRKNLATLTLNLLMCSFKNNLDTIPQ